MPDPTACSSGHAAIATWEATPPRQPTLNLFLPLAVLATDDIDPADPRVIGRLNEDELLVDAFASDAFVRCLVDRMLHRTEKVGGLQFANSSKGSLLNQTLPWSWRIARSAAEQSKTSVRVGDHAMLKAIRKLQPGVHPELEMSRFFSEETRFDATPALLGWADLQGMTIAMLQGFVPNQGDGWNWIAAHLKNGGAQRAKNVPVD